MTLQSKTSSLLLNLIIVDPFYVTMVLCTLQIYFIGLFILSNQRTLNKPMAAVSNCSVGVIDNTKSDLAVSRTPRSQLRSVMDPFKYELFLFIQKYPKTL